MSKSKIQSCPIPSMPKENTLGMDGMNEIFISSPHLVNHAGNTGTDWAWLGMDGIRAGLFFHWCNEGRIENQGHLLALDAGGHGTAQLFEWFWGNPSKVIEVTPAYLSACVFYTTCAAMNSAYARWEAAHE